MWEPKMYSGWMMSGPLSRKISHYPLTMRIRYLLQMETGDPFSDRRGKESRIFKSLLTTGKWKRVDTGGKKVMSKADVIEVEGVVVEKLPNAFSK